MDAVIGPRKEPDDKSEKCGNSLANFLAKSPHDINDKGSDETTYNHLPKRCNKNNNQGKSNKNPQTLIGITRSPLSSSVCHNHPLQELSCSIQNRVSQSLRVIIRRGNCSNRSRAGDARLEHRSERESRDQHSSRSNATIIFEIILQLLNMILFYRTRFAFHDEQTVAIGKSTIKFTERHLLITWALSRRSYFHTYPQIKNLACIHQWPQLQIGIFFQPSSANICSEIITVWDLQCFSVNHQRCMIPLEGCADMRCREIERRIRFSIGRLIRPELLALIKISEQVPLLPEF